MFLTRLGFGSKCVVTGDVDAGRSADGKEIRPARVADHPRGRRRHPLLRLHRQGRRAPSARGEDRRGVRPHREGTGERQRGRAVRGVPGARSLVTSIEVSGSVPRFSRVEIGAFVRKVLLTLEKLGHIEDEGVSEVSIAFVDDEAMRSLNRRFRHKASTTDVLTFRADDSYGDPSNGGGRPSATSSSRSIRRGARRPPRSIPSPSKCATSSFTASCTLSDSTTRRIAAR